MRLKKEEFDKILQELFGESPVRYDTLCDVLWRELLPTVRGWCAVDTALQGRNCEEDIIQDTVKKVIKYCITGFFLRKGRTEPNTDKDAFCRWVYVVARNVKKDYSNSARERIIVDYNELEEKIGDDVGESHETEELSRIFDIVFSLDMGIHKLLAWLAVSVTILGETDKRKVATEMVVDRFARKTLDEIWEYHLKELRRYPSLAPTEKEITDVRDALNARDELGIRLGEREFYTFFMTKGGKYSVSDWLHKINQLIKRRFRW